MVDFISCHCSSGYAKSIFTTGTLTCIKKIITINNLNSILCWGHASKMLIIKIFFETCFYWITWKIFSSFILIFAWNISIYYLTNFFIFCESVEVKYCKYQCFSHYIAIRDLSKSHNINRKSTNPCKLTLNLNDSLKTGSRVFLWTFVSNFLFLSGRR